MSSRVHSLDGSLTRPDWRPIDAADLESLAAHFPESLRGARPVWHSPRPFSAAAIVRSDAGEFFVKRHDARVRDAAALLEEHEWIGHLREHGAPVPRVLRDVRGRGAVTLRGAVFEVHERMQGEDLYRDAHSWEPVRGLSSARALGRTIARLHMASAGYDAPLRPARALTGGSRIAMAGGGLSFLAEFIAERPALDAYARGHGLLAALAPRLEAWLASLAPQASEFAPLWVHNDLHVSNVSWTPSGDEVVAVFDFGLANSACALADLATAIERNCIAWLDAGRRVGLGRPDLARAIIDGYCERLPVSPARRAALCALLPVCHVEFALSEVDYFAGVLADPDRAALAAQGFLQGHLDWFASGEGREFLDEVGRPASPAAVPSQRR